MQTFVWYLNIFFKRFILSIINFHEFYGLVINAIIFIPILDYKNPTDTYRTFIFLISKSKCQKSTLHLKVIVVKTYIKRYISLQVHLQSLVLLASFFSTRKLLNYKLYFSTSSCQCVLQKQLLPNKKYYQPHIAVF